MNSYKIISIDKDVVCVEFTVNGKVVKESLGNSYNYFKLAASYVSVQDSEKMDSKLQEFLTALVADAAVVEIPAEVKAMVNKVTPLEVKAVEEVMPTE